MNMIIPQDLPASWGNLTGSDVLNIKVLAKFDVDLCATFLKFQASRISTFKYWITVL